MKISVLILVVLTSIAKAQQSADLLIGNADYAIPDPAAFHILQPDAAAFLRPSTVRNATLAMGESVLGYSTAKSFGVEVAPILLGGITQADYLSGRWRRVLVRMRFSAAASFPDYGSNHAAFGIRMMFHDDADLRADSSFADRWSKSNHSHAALDSIRTSMKEALWNKTVAEGAAAVSMTRNGTELLPDRVALWLSGAVPMCGASAQLSFGLSEMWQRGPADWDRWQNILGITVRWEVGSYNERMFIQGRWVDNAYQGTSTSNTGHATALDLGGEMNIANGCWAECTAGVTQANYVAPDLHAMLMLKVATRETY